MTDDDIRALVAQLEVMADEPDDISGYVWVGAARRAAAALTALMAERDEARVQATELLESRVMWANLAKEHQETGQRHWEQLQTARRAAFARAKEIAEHEWVLCESERGYYSRDDYQCGLREFALAKLRRVASAIEAEMRSDEAQHSVQPLAELEPEVKHDPDPDPLEDEV